MKLIDFPVIHELSDYTSAINEVISILSEIDGIISIYQIGNTGTPGISDIDLIAVFDNNVNYLFNPLESLSPEYSYLFKHNIYGTNKTTFENGFKYTYFHNYNLLHGKNIIPLTESRGNYDSFLKKQIALEYLIRSYVSLSIELEYKMIKLRSLFLHAKGMLYDIDYLNITDPGFIESLNSLLYIRDNWFTNTFSHKTLESTIFNFFDELKSTLESALNHYGLYFPPSKSINISKNISFKSCESLGYRKQGFVLPFHYFAPSNFSIKLLNRLCGFVFLIPNVQSNPPAYINDYFAFSINSRYYNLNCLSYFLPFTMSMF